jgi:hypothetical protein
MGFLSQTASANRDRGVLFSDREMDGVTNPSSLGIVHHALGAATGPAYWNKVVFEKLVDRTGVRLRQ